MSESSGIRECLYCKTKNRVDFEKVPLARCGSCKMPLITTYYEVLGITQSATSDDVKKAYRHLALKWHPDQNPDNTFANDIFKTINEAYVVLSNPSKRESYNISLQSSYQTYTAPEMGPDEAAQIFMSEMFRLAAELAFSNHNWSKIYPELISRGCPAEIARYVAQSCVAYRKGVVRQFAFKAFLKALFWFAVGGVITLVTYANAKPGDHYLVLWGFIAFGGYHMVKALYFLITGEVPMHENVQQSFNSNVGG